MTYGYFTADISTDAAYARPTDLRKSALRAFTGENFPSAPADAFPISAPPKIRKYLWAGDSDVQKSIAGVVP